MGIDKRNDGPAREQQLSFDLDPLNEERVVADIVLARRQRAILLLEGLAHYLGERRAVEDIRSFRRSLHSD